MTQELKTKIQHILYYYYEDEVKDLEEFLGTEDDDFEELPENLSEAIKLIEEKYPAYMSGMGYILMTLKKEIQDNV